MVIKTDFTKAPEGADRETLEEKGKRMAKRLAFAIAHSVRLRFPDLVEVKLQIEEAMCFQPSGVFFIVRYDDFSFAFEWRTVRMADWSDDELEKIIDRLWWMDRYRSELEARGCLIEGGDAQ